MAMKNCVECGGAVSTRAKSCPHCGNRHPTRKTSLGVKIIIGLLVLAGIGWAIEAMIPGPVLDSNVVQFRVVDSWGGGLGQVVVIDPSDRSEERLRQLCLQFSDSSRSDQSFSAFVYDDPTAAMLRQDAERMESAAPFPEHDDHLVAVYSKNATTGLGECVLSLDGVGDDSELITISL